MNIFIPDELKPVEDDIKRFVDGMVYKLRKNSHKGNWEGMDLPATLARLQDEAAELKQAIEEGNVIEVVLEAADVANFALIASSVALRKEDPKPVDKDFPYGVRLDLRGSQDHLNHQSSITMEALRKESAQRQLNDALESPFSEITIEMMDGKVRRCRWDGDTWVLQPDV